MKLILLLLAVAFTCVIAQGDTEVNPITHAIKEWTGTTTLGPVWYPPNTANTPCQTATTSQNYAVMNATFATSGTRIINVVAERGFFQYIVTYVYNTTFTPSATSGSLDSCAGSPILMQINNGDMPAYLKTQNPFYFVAGVQYFFVVTSNNPEKTGRFAVSISASTFMGTTVGGPQWQPSTTDATGCVLTPTTVAKQSVAVFNYAATISGNVDIQVFFASSALSYDQYRVYVTLTAGKYTAADFAANPCTRPTNTSAFITGYNGDQITPIYRFPVTPGDYTFAVSNVQEGAFGIQLIPTPSISATSIPPFQQPQRTLPCAPNATATNTGRVVLTIPASAHGQQVFIDTYPYPSYVQNSVYFSNYAFVYSGSNTQSTCVASAPLIAVNQTNLGGTGSIVFSTQPGREYNVIFSPSEAGALPANAQLPIYVFAGEWVGNPATYVPDNSATTTTGATVTTGATASSTGAQGNSTTSATSGGSTTGATASSTGAASTGTGGAVTTATTTETSSASAIAVSALVLVSIAALL